MLDYRQFVPRLYNWCKQLGMTPGKIIPSIGFCADENQGYPAITVLKNFGAYPFTHGYLGGILALDRHGPHAHHGKDAVIIHAPHVGYDPDTSKYGIYRRQQVEDVSHQHSTCCGAVDGTLARYRAEYAAALAEISVKVEGDSVLVQLGNTIMRERRAEGLFLEYGRMLEAGISEPYELQSTSQVFVASEGFGAAVKARLASTPVNPSGQVVDLPGKEKSWRSLSEPGLKDLLEPSMFYYKRPEETVEGEAKRLERTLLPHMSSIVYGPHDDTLTAALVIMQSEFDRMVHSVSTADAYKGKNLLVVSGCNIDVSPSATETEAFPSTMYLPWAAYVKLADGREQVLEQSEYVEALFAQSATNNDAIDIENGIAKLFQSDRQRVKFFDRSSGNMQVAKTL